MYNAIVARISVREHPNADRLALGDVAGHQVIVSKDTEDGQLGVFFPSDGQLSEEFAKEHDLVRRKDKNGKQVGGFFEENRRVRSQGFRGEKSEGFFCPLSHLDYTGVNHDVLVEGFMFRELNGHKICQKYFTPATEARRKLGRSGKANRIIRTFPRHVDTEQWRFLFKSLPEGTVLYLSEKLHGTSQRFGKVWDQPVDERDGWQKALGAIGLWKRAPKPGYYNNLGTRNVVLDKQGETYGSEKYRTEVVERYGLQEKLQEGEILYFEVVGYTESGSGIMGNCDTKKLDKGMVERYGETMTWSYGNLPGTCDMHVYRIVQMSKDPEHYVELPWPQVVRRCKELGVKSVPTDIIQDHPVVLTNDNRDNLNEIINDALEGPSTLDSKHIREGIGIRAELPSGEVKFLKAKSFSFGVLEGYLKNSSDYVDTEEVA